MARWLKVWQKWDMLGLMQQIQSAGLGPTSLAAKA